LSYRLAKLRFNFGQLAYEQAELDRNLALVIADDGDSISLAFRQLDPGAEVSATLLFRVRDNLSNGDVVALSLEYFCRTGLCFGNNAEVQVSTGAVLNTTDNPLLLSVSPASGDLTTVFRFATRKFPYRDSVQIWAGDNSGIRQLPQTYRVGADGWLRFELTGADLGAGTRNIMIYGNVSGFSSTTNVTVNAAGTTLATAPLQLPRVDRAHTATSTTPIPAPTQSNGQGGITGVVTAADTNAGLAELLVVLTPTEGDGRPAATALTNSDGRYLIPTGLASGTYTVTLRAASAGLGAYQDAVYPQPVTISEPEMTRGIDLALIRGGTISDRITAADTNRGLAGVGVIVQTGSRAIIGSGASTADGAYEIEGIPAGTYQLIVIPATGDDGDVVAYEGTSIADVSVAAGATATRNAALNLRATIAKIRGTVSGTDGGLAHVLVLVFNAQQELVDLTMSAADGSYATGALGNGSYTLGFLTTFAGDRDVRNYISAYYGGSDAAGATPVEITAAGAIDGIDVTLVPGGRISGRALVADDTGLGEVLVAAFDATGSVQGLAVSAADGTYELAGLTTGTYRVGFFAEYAEDALVRRYQDGFYNGASGFSGATDVAVTAGSDATAIDNTLTLGGVITGRVVADDGGAGLAGIVVIVFDATERIIAVSYTDRNGTYTTPGLAPGTYNVLFDTYFDNRSNPPYTSVSVTAGGTSTANAGLARGGQIAGRVTAADSGLGLGGVAVLVSDGDTLVSITATDASGAYTTSGLPAGSYTITFSPLLATDLDVRGYQSGTLTEPVTVVVGEITEAVNTSLSKP
jgi:hypothetical protein